MAVLFAKDGGIMNSVEWALLFYEAFTVSVVLLIAASRRDFLHSLTVMAVCVVLIKRLMFVNEEWFEKEMAAHAFLGIVALRIVSYFRRVPFIWDDNSLMKFLYRAATVQPIGWVWTKRVHGFLNKIVKVVDAASIMLPPCVVLFLDRGGIDNVYVALGAFLIVWGVFLLWIAIPLVVLEAIARFYFSFANSRRKDDMRQSLRYAKERGTSKAKSGAKKVHAWLRAGFERDN